MGKGSPAQKSRRRVRLEFVTGIELGHSIVKKLFLFSHLSEFVLCNLIVQIIDVHFFDRLIILLENFLIPLLSDFTSFDSEIFVLKPVSFLRSLDMCHFHMINEVVFL